MYMKEHLIEILNEQLDFQKWNPFRDVTQFVVNTTTEEKYPNRPELGSDWGPALLYYDDQGGRHRFCDSRSKPIIIISSACLSENLTRWWMG